MNIPSTYADWVPLLKQFADSPNTDAELVPILESGAISWSEGVAEKFANRCADCLTARLDHVQKKYNQELQHSQGKLDGIVAATVSVRKNLKPLVKFANIEGFPQELQSYLQENLKGIVEEMQRSLEEDLEQKAKHSTTDANILVAVRKNPIRLPTEEETYVGSENVESQSTDNTSPQFIRKKKKLQF